MGQLTDMSSADYSELVECLSEIAAVELRDAKGKPDEKRSALCRYYIRGIEAGLATGELVDYLGVSTPNILERAGFREDEALELMRVSASLTDDELSLTDDELKRCGQHGAES